MRPKYKLFVNISILFGAVCCGSTAFCSETLDVPRASEVQRVEVLLTHPGLRALIPLNEVELKKVGCSFTSSSQSNITHLISILDKNLLVSTEGKVSFEPRNAVYLYRKDGTIFKLLMGRGGEAVNSTDGRVIQAKGVQEVPVLVNKRLFEQVGEWSKTADIEKPLSSRCGESK